MRRLFRIHGSEEVGIELIFDLGRNQPRPQHASSRHNGLSCLSLTILYDLARFDRLALAKLAKRKIEFNEGRIQGEISGRDEWARI